MPAIDPGKGGRSLSLKIGAPKKQKKALAAAGAQTNI
jgi:hypothetical protein